MSDQLNINFRAKNYADIDNKVLFAIVRSRGFISGREVAQKCGITEREVRRVVKKLVEQYKYPIVSKSGDNGGYKYTNDPEELLRARNRLIKHAFSELDKARAFDKTGYVQKLQGQIEMELQR